MPSSAIEQFDFPPYRPPSEAYSMLLRVSRGCPWNKCAFCSMYKKYSFARKSVDEIKKDIDLMPQVYGTHARTAFLGDSNSLLLKTADLVAVLEHLYRVFPHLEWVTSYARAKTLTKKPLTELQAIREAGLTRLHIGLESGDDQVLALIRKGATAAEMIAAGRLSKEAGFECSMYVLLGIGGVEHTMAHRQGTVRVLNEVDPHFIRVRTLTPIPKTPIARWIEEGSFTLISPLMSVEEELDIVRGLRVSSRFLNDHVSNIVPLDGKLPDDQPQMIAALEAAVAYCQKSEVDYRDYRSL
ncbi:MAG: radical SAM protein [Deltaproteobacteria bacterium]|nr:radical SAM protein [Candidatus Anaeroferrophillus wilburensis]MBN2889679.1 radical SAM protein [Deltaproteobacteria bacterium]